MDSTVLNLNIDYLGTAGVILSPEQKAALQTSLCILKNNGKYQRVYFWGKILGIKEDYFIAQGIETDEFSERKVWYSKDCSRWALLPPATEDMMSRAKLIRGRFIGDPSYEFEYTPPKADEEEEEPETITIKEEDRLASIIFGIDKEARIVPRGAYIQEPTGLVYQSRTFAGLTVSEASKLCNYVHFREGLKVLEKTLLQKADLDKSVDFMDPIDEDIPLGCWSLQFDRGSALTILKNLLWPGYVFFHVPETRRYGSIYFGTGEKNIDLPFMI